MPIDTGLCFSTIAMTAVAGLRRRAGRRRSTRRASARAVLRRARPRPAGDLDRARARAAGRGRAAARARDDPRRRRARTELVASLAPKPWPDGAGNGVPRALLAVGGRAQPLPRRPERTGCPPSGARVPRRRARAPARPVRADRAELQLLPADRARHVGGRVRLLGLRQPRGAGARAVAVPGRGGGVDQRRAQGRRRELQPVPRARRADRGGAGRGRAGSEPPEPVRRRPGDDAQDRSASARHPPPPRDARPRRWTRSPPTRCSRARSGRCLRSRIWRCRRSEWDGLLSAGTPRLSSGGTS